MADSNQNQTRHLAAPIPAPQVFNASDNQFTYNEAAAVCKAYGADLAMYSQVEEAYRKGGEWCNYGWSTDQLALYPTQQATYDKLAGNKTPKTYMWSSGGKWWLHERPPFNIGCELL